jgi:hypothetical protein
LGMTPDFVRRRGNGGGCNKSAMTVQGRSSAAADIAHEGLAIAANARYKTLIACSRRLFFGPTSRRTFHP